MPGARPGHPGTRRDTPEQIDWQADHRADRCPDRGARLKRCQETRIRYSEDIPEIEPEVTEHTIHRDWCPKYKRGVEPQVPDALPGSTPGNRSQRGADCQAVLMSVFRTLKGRGHDPIQTVVDALATYLTTGQLPALPKPQTTSDS